MHLIHLRGRKHVIPFSKPPDLPECRITRHNCSEGTRRAARKLFSLQPRTYVHVDRTAGHPGRPAIP